MRISPSTARSIMMVTLVGAVAGACQRPAAEPITGDDSIDRLVNPLRQPAAHKLGEGGGICNVLAEPSGMEVLDGLQVRAGLYVDAIRLSYRNRATGATRLTSWLGGPGGGPQPPEPIQFSPGEKLLRIDVNRGVTIDSIKFTTTHNVYGPFGGGRGSPAFYETPMEGNERREIHGFHVNFCKDFSDGNAIGSISPIDYLPCETCGSLQSVEVHEGWGGAGGGTFSFEPHGDEFLAAIQLRLTAEGGWIAGMRANFRSASTGESQWRPWAGGGSFPLDEFHLGEGEFLIGMEARGYTEITGMGFWTSFGRHYGPFGDAFRFDPFQHEGRVHGGLRRRIQGFTGRSGNLLDFVRVIDNFGGCEHFACTEGSPLQSTCDPCVRQICAADTFCCTNAWDAICVSEVSSICGLTCGEN